MYLQRVIDAHANEEYNKFAFEACCETFAINHRSCFPQIKYKLDLLYHTGPQAYERIGIESHPVHAGSSPAAR